MVPSKKLATIAGCIYLIVVLTGIFSLAYVPSKLIDWNNAATTTNNIIASETLFRLSIVAGICCYIAFLFLPLVLYRLLHHIQESAAKCMVILAVISVPISLINLLNKFHILTLIHTTNAQQLVELKQLQTQVMRYLDYYDNGIQLASIFWGLWLFPFGYLVWKSDFLPKILGLFLMAGCFGYLINFIGNFLLPNYAELGISKFISLPATFGEIGICLWLLFFGIKRTKSTVTN
ncbi:MAG TPA: DUF4386 domain-containing protein [Bacteroidia bacterium]|jgi:hypothetical protein|nr:DUF4386 domain-containing protein [Bacteroidia bacterium]